MVLSVRALERGGGAMSILCPHAPIVTQLHAETGGRDAIPDHREGIAAINAALFGPTG